VSGGAEVLAEALRRLDGCVADIFDVGLRRPDLDDVFLALTGHTADDGAPDDENDEEAPAAEPVATGGSAR
jgi:ABC-2 type transport system ATP-binding protein